MPFVGVLPERKYLFRPEPRRQVAVSDAAAWRLNPRHRHVYDKLRLALEAGLTAAPCGVAPMDLGVAPKEEVFVKPITNLSGMGLDARAMRAGDVPAEPGSFWCQRLTGLHTSTDCLVQEGVVRWFAHTRASAEKDAARPIYWEIGAALPELESWIHDWVERHLAGYSGLFNIELIGGQPIEAHLRGSNGFFDFYGADFLPAWVSLADGEAFTPPPAPEGGFVISVFGEADLSKVNLQAAESAGVRVQPDDSTPGRAAILRCHDLEAGARVYRQLAGRTLQNS
ncbi:hypothetical protein [Ectothiorhodospira sp. BSL-9]|uniref:hypothetical protein n=1 Tax=Ectothiorhodospira sp. BSL-9 TaxID=1442136 RepID=UPI0007B45286|nr:hypothetical protein [Ectothiorhodospira sp. BSL-9]ANB03373.1 hypothetical protein ECTOBSL9_3018 [Ectothiorhodospira sp. BSL-9]TVQ73082.1 MAG: hypothetical protein EA372_06100 [Chromatiaceae bacterium]